MRLRLLDSAMFLLLRLIKTLDRRDDTLARIEHDHIRSVLIVSSTALGDLVVSSAAFAPIRARFPHARIVALVHSANVPLLCDAPEIDKIVPYYGGYRGFVATIAALRRAAPEIALILHGNEPQATPLAYLSGARWIVKFPNRSPFHFLLSNREPPVIWRDMGHGINQRLRVAAAVGADIADARMHLPISPKTREQVEKFFETRNFHAGRRIGLQCGASAASRMWPAEKFAALGKRLITAHPDIGIVLTGAPDERSYLAGIARAIGDRAIVTAGELPLECLPALVGSCACLVTGDTGTMHIAFAVNTPAVCLFAVSDPATSGPPYDFEQHVVIHHPCPDLAIRTKSDDSRCIARIEADEVLAAVERILGRADA